MAGLRDRVAVGRVRGLHGLRGAVRVEVLTDRPDERFAEGAIVLAGDRELTVAEHRPVPGGRGIFIRFLEVPDREAADALRDLDLEVEVDPERDLGDDEVFWHELRGVRVTSVDGMDLGTVQDVYRAGEAEVLSVAGGDVRPFELPVVRAFIAEWAPREGRIVVDALALGVEPVRPRRPRPPRPRPSRHGAGARKATDAAATSPAELGAQPGGIAEAPGQDAPPAADPIPPAEGG